jgi:hypothetical protein
MIGAMSGGEGMTGLSAMLLATQPPGVGAAGSLTGGEGGSSIASSSASVSSPGQLLSNLYELQTQNPTAFTQVVTQIANQLQAAAQQAQGPASPFLSSLAQKFQNIADGGSLAQLQPSHAHDHAPQAYAQQGTGATQGLAGLGSVASGQPSGSSLRQLLTTISSEVSKALTA